MPNACGWVGLEPGTAAELAAVTVPRRWHQNAILFRRGDPCTGVHFLQAGLIKLYVASRSGREQIFHLISNAEPLVITPLIDNQPYAVGACALIESHTWFLAREDFDRFYRTRPDFVHAVCLHMTRRLREMVTITHEVTLKPLSARVAWHLVEQARIAGVLENGAAFQLTTNQTEMARLLCATRESVARALSELRRAGVIEQHGPQVRIRQLDALVDCANSGQSRKAIPNRAPLRLSRSRVQPKVRLLA